MSRCTLKERNETGRCRCVTPYLRRYAAGASVTEYAFVLAVFMAIFVLAVPSLSINSAGAACKAGAVLGTVAGAPGTDAATLAALIGARTYGKSGGQYCCGVVVAGGVFACAP